MAQNHAVVPCSGTCPSNRRLTREGAAGRPLLPAAAALDRLDRAGRQPIKKTLRNIAVFALLVVALYFLLPRLVDAEGTLELITGANWWLLLLAVLLEVMAILAYANLTRFILRVLAIRLRLIDVLSITLSSLAVSHIFSAGGAGGWVVTYNALMKRRVPHGLIFVAIAAQQFFNYVVLWFVFAFALIYLVVRGQSIMAYGGGILVIALILGLTGYGIYLYTHRSRMRLRVGQIAALANRIARREVINENHIDGWLDNLFAGMRRMTSHRHAIPKTAAQACGFWLFDMLGLWVVFMAFGHGIGLSSVAVCYVVAYAIGTLAPTPGGLGAIEGLLIALFVSFGVPSATAVTVVLVYRLINFWLPILPGLVAYVIVRPGRKPVAEGEIEQAAEEVCGISPVTGMYTECEAEAPDASSVATAVTAPVVSNPGVAAETALAGDSRARGNGGRLVPLFGLRARNGRRSRDAASRDVPGSGATETVGDAGGSQAPGAQPGGAGSLSR